MNNKFKRTSILITSLIALILMLPVAYYTQVFQKRTCEVKNDILIINGRFRKSRYYLNTFVGDTNFIFTALSFNSGNDSDKEILSKNCALTWNKYQESKIKKT